MQVHSSYFWLLGHVVHMYKNHTVQRQGYANAPIMLPKHLNITIKKNDKNPRVLIIMLVANTLHGVKVGKP